MLDFLLLMYEHLHCWYFDMITEIRVVSSMKASMEDHKEVVSLLVEHGARVDLADLEVRRNIANDTGRFAFLGFQFT